MRQRPAPDPPSRSNLHRQQRRQRATPIDRRQKKPPFYLPLAEGGEELVAPGGGSIRPTPANASIAIFQVPLSVFSILSQLPWMVLSLTSFPPPIRHHCRAVQC